MTNRCQDDVLKIQKVIEEAIIPRIVSATIDQPSEGKRDVREEAKRGHRVVHGQPPGELRRNAVYSNQGVPTEAAPKKAIENVLEDRIVQSVPHVVDVEVDLLGRQDLLHVFDRSPQDAGLST